MPAPKIRSAAAIERASEVAAKALAVGGAEFKFGTKAEALRSRQFLHSAKWSLNKTVEDPYHKQPLNQVEYEICEEKGFWVLKVRPQGLQLFDTPFYSSKTGELVELNLSRPEPKGKEGENAIEIIANISTYLLLTNQATKDTVDVLARKRFDDGFRPTPDQYRLPGEEDFMRQHAIAPTINLMEDEE